MGNSYEGAVHGLYLCTVCDYNKYTHSMLYYVILLASLLPGSDSVNTVKS